MAKQGSVLTGRERHVLSLMRSNPNVANHNTVAARGLTDKGYIEHNHAKVRNSRTYSINDSGNESNENKLATSFPPNV